MQSGWSAISGQPLHNSRKSWHAPQHRGLHVPVQAAVGVSNGSSSSSSDAPIALRVVDEALHVEAERSYLAVCGKLGLACKHRNFNTSGTEMHHGSCSTQCL